MEAKLLSAMLASREAFSSLTKLSVTDDLSQLGKQVYKRIASYYQRDSSASCADPDIVLDALIRELPMSEDKFRRVFETLPEVSVANVLDYLKHTRLTNLSLEVRAAMDKGDSEKASELMSSYISINAEGIDAGPDKAATYAVRNDVASSELLAPLEEGNSFLILPRELGEIMTGLIPGDHILIFAPPEVGKSCVAINMATGLCRSGKRVLYIGNEDPEQRMLLRFKSRFSGMTREQINADRELADERARARGYGNLFFVRLYPGTVEDVFNLCLQVKPDVCIVDQLVNLRFANGKEPSKTELLEQLAYAVRMFYSKHHILGISLSQADEKAIGKEYLTIRDVYYSNIGVQGQCDVMVGIGMTYEMQRIGLRYLNVVKNKASGEHSGIRVTLDNKLSYIKAT